MTDMSAGWMAFQPFLGTCYFIALKLVSDTTWTHTLVTLGHVGLQS